MASSSHSSSADPLSETRLYIGNLHPAVDEYTLVQTFSRYGKIAKLDFLFHKAGPQRGQPRGYAFLEYSKKEEAVEAVAQANGKTLKARRLTVSHARHSQYPEEGRSGGTGPHRRTNQEATRPTTLSIIKNASKPEGTDAKIAAMEAKLAALRAKKAAATSGTVRPTSLPSSSSSSSTWAGATRGGRASSPSQKVDDQHALPPKPRSPPTAL